MSQFISAIDTASISSLSTIEVSQYWRWLTLQHRWHGLLYIIGLSREVCWLYHTSCWLTVDHRFHNNTHFRASDKSTIFLCNWKYIYYFSCIVSVLYSFSMCFQKSLWNYQCLLLVFIGSLWYKNKGSLNTSKNYKTQLYRLCFLVSPVNFYI